MRHIPCESSNLQWITFCSPTDGKQIITSLSNREHIGKSRGMVSLLVAEQSTPNWPALTMTPNSLQQTVYWLEVDPWVILGNFTFNNAQSQSSIWSSFTPSERCSMSGSTEVAWDRTTGQYRQKTWYSEPLYSALLEIKPGYRGTCPGRTTR